MEAFYEESSIAQDSKKASKRYAVMNVFSIALLVWGIISGIMFILCIPDPAFMFFWGIQTLSAMVFWFLLFKVKSRTNGSFDYCFVSGELRISKVFNVNKRKLVARIQAEDILQLGDVENTSYDRLSQDPNTKQIICTPNVEALDGKFFMYILVADSGKQLYVLECRELLLMNILKFTRRGVLETDYVMQEKKQR
jgi:hypothetical protein